MNDQINAWLDSQLISPVNGNIADKWKAFLIQEGYTFKSLPDTQFEYLGDEGYTGPLAERYAKWIEDTF